MILFVTAEYHDVVKQPGIVELQSVTLPIATSDRNKHSLEGPDTPISPTIVVRARYQPFVVSLYFHSPGEVSHDALKGET
jgi:hypothetical protein